jgi:cytochrome c oxidase cbb3-type subunit 4
MTYETLVPLTYLATLILFGAIFAGVVVYAFWPGNKSKFDRAARVPLERDQAMEGKGGPA